MFRRKAEVVRAVQWMKEGDHPDVFHERMEGWAYEVGCSKCPKHLSLHGDIYADGRFQSVCPGDWIVTDRDGRVSVFKPKEFEKLFEPYNGPNEETGGFE